MKSLTLRASVALTCALSLAACGGSSGNLLLGGSIRDLFKPGLVLQNKNGPLLPIAAGATTFAFHELIGNDEEFEVKIATPPTGAKCTLADNKGKSGAFNITSIIITCATNTYDLGGTITGLDSGSLVLVNGSDRATVTAGAPGATIGFKMSKVADGAPYGVTVLTQPSGRTCSVENGVNTMGTAEVANIKVTCKPAAATLSGESL